MIKIINNELSEADQTIAIVPTYHYLLIDKSEYAIIFITFLCFRPSLISTIRDHNCSFVEVRNDQINAKILLSDKELKSLIPTICRILNELYFIFDD